MTAGIRGVRAQTRMELILQVRRAESLVVTFAIPLLLLVFLTTTDLGDIDFLAPGVLALSIISATMVSLAISTGFDRSYGVLKLIGGSPLTRTQLITAKLSAVVVLELVQISLVVAASVALGWRPAGNWFVAFVVMAVGTVCFAGLGLLMAGNLRAEGTLALSNALFFVFLLLGGIVFTTPEFLASVTDVLPAYAFGESLRAAFGGGAVFGASAFWVLCGWAVLFTAAAARTFKWE